MSPELLVLLSTAATLGCAHTAIGIDHTLPFIVLGKARHWPLHRTLLLTAVCGLAHVLSSAVIGAIGWCLGLSSSGVAGFESGRGSFAAWLLVVFGLLYAAYGFWRLRSGTPHRHFHVQFDGTVHSHRHGHQLVNGTAVHTGSHRLVPPPQVEQFAALREGSLPPLALAQVFPRRVWPALLIIFVLGPCEALVPLMFGSALLTDPGAAWWVAGVFGGATVGTMMLLVWLGHTGLSLRALGKLEPHFNWLAGVAIALSGLAVQLGL